MNAGEAEKCLQLSKDKYKLGNAAAALKFARKSVALQSTQEAVNWLKFLNSQQSSADSQPKAKPDNTARKQPAKETRDWKPEQAAGIKNILGLKKKGDLYGVLGLEKGATESEIKKSYRKQALLYHPDKNCAPGADEAFKAVAGAFGVLGDASKKSNYDLYGVDSADSANGGAAQQQFRGFESGNFGGQQVSPEELFRMFMGNGFGNYRLNRGGEGFGGQFGGQQFHFGQRNQARRNQRNQPQFAQQHHPQAPQNLIGQIFQFLPLIILFLFSILSMFGGEDSVFQFNYSRDYSKKLSTTLHQVTYFVNPNKFTRSYNTPQKRKSLGNLVEQEVR